MGIRVQPDLKTQHTFEIRDQRTGVAREKRPGGPPSHHALKPNPGLGPGFDQQASEPTSGPALPFPTPRSARPLPRFALPGTLRSRLGAGGARRLTPSHIAQQKFKNQKPSLVRHQEDYNPTESFHRPKTGHGGRGAPLVT